MTDKKHKLSKEELLAQEAEFEKQEEARRNNTLAPFEIHVMPKKFQNAQVTLPSTKSSGSTSKIILFVLIGILIAGLLVFGAYKLYVSLSAPVQEPIVSNEQPVIPEPITETPTPEPTPTPAPTPTPEPIVEPVVTPQPTTPQPTTSSIDTDSDGLTDVEEALYGTTIRVPDTDNDGFVDGQEVINQYSPVAVNSAITTLAAINTFINSAHSYSILHPSLWLARSTDDSKAVTVFTSVTGEFATVEALNNTAGESLSVFLVNNQPQVNPTTLSAMKTRKGLDGYVNATKTLYYINAPVAKKVYKVTYDSSAVTRVNFLTTFEMMINSLMVL